ncbi:ABC transporter permease [Hyphomicrobium sp.]|uniref:ABC transporter permease n=1 Tax=Hyphomicrobium sp. TaxID=82 RepID=UPI0025C2A5FB|nr:ABC transporter permease [Hyphomicrobium sp.]MCC7252163.1 ABC transporter permease [Hyphomicrobium sp.]
MQQLLWLETLLKLAGGAALVLAPLATIKILGLPASASGFWPRLLGAVLIGIAGATFIEGAWEGSRGLGIAGLIMINLLSAAVVALVALFGVGAQTRRGAAALWVLVVLLLVLVLVEIAHA